MSRTMHVFGGIKLHGEISAQGAKNAALPLLAACLLSEGKTILSNCPNISDVENMLLILEDLGCKCTRDKNTVSIDASNVEKWIMPEDLGQRLRSSFFLLGPVLGRFKRALFTYPGGCAIGLRPIDLHLKGLRQLNVNISEVNGYIDCSTDTLIGSHIHLDYPSVGATENIMMAAVTAKGETIIDNAAQEPEIVDLQSLLNKMGAKVEGAGNRRITIVGVNGLNSVEYDIMPDRIETGTFLCAGAITGGEINIKKCCPEHIGPVIAKLEDMGCEINTYKDRIWLKSNRSLVSARRIDTMPYPGFPTDMQAQICAVAAMCSGVTLITETVFESRFKHIDQLQKMGVKAMVCRRMAIIEGVKDLHAAKVYAQDLRGGAALIICALAADGESVINEVEHIERGYENIEEKLRSLGAHIRIDDV